MDVNDFIGMSKKAIIKIINCEFGNAVYGKKFKEDDIHCEWISMVRDKAEGQFNVDGLKDRFFRIKQYGPGKLAIEGYELTSYEVVK